MAKNTLTVRTEKTAATEDELRDSLTEAYPEFSVASIEEVGNLLEATLEKTYEHVAASPFEKSDSDDGDSDGSGEKKEKKPPKEKSEKPAPKGDDEEGDLDDGPSFGDEDGDSEGGDGPDGFGAPKAADPLKDIHHLLTELTHAVKELEGKAGLVDEIHQKIKPHIEEAPIAGGGDLGPTAPGGGNPMGGPGGASGPGGPPGAGGPPGGGGAGGPGGAPGGPPPIPRRPMPAKGFDRRIRDPQRGLPSAFTHKYVYVPIESQGTEFTLAEALDAVKTDDRYSNYRVAGVQEDLRNSRYILKLVK